MPDRRPGRPPTGRAQTAAERMRRYRARRRAAGLRVATRWLPAASAAISPGVLKHRIIEARSLAMHCLIARKIEADRRLLAAAPGAHREFQYRRLRGPMPGSARPRDLQIRRGPGKGPRVHARARAAWDDGQADTTQEAGGDEARRRDRKSSAGKGREGFPGARPVS